MFSKAAVPKSFLLLPLILLIIVFFLLFLVVQRFDAINTAATQTTQETNKNLPNPTAPPTSKSAESSDVMFKAPKGNYPANKCPEILVKESSGNNFAIEANEKYSLSSANAEWVIANCPAVKTITF